nr:translation initiation factor IF-2-like [Saimiri boliviensis boliviensis]
MSAPASAAATGPPRPSGRKQSCPRPLPAPRARGPPRGHGFRRARAGLTGFRVRASTSGFPAELGAGGFRRWAWISLVTDSGGAGCAVVSPHEKPRSRKACRLGQQPGSGRSGRPRRLGRGVASAGGGRGPGGRDPGLGRAGAVPAGAPRAASGPGTVDSEARGVVTAHRRAERGSVLLFRRNAPPNPFREARSQLGYG